MAATLAALLLALPGTAVAAPGDLDTAFAGDGTVLTDFGGNDSANDVAVQSDGRIVSVGTTFDSSGSESDFALTRHNPDGSLDTTFGGDGRVTTAVNNLPSNDGLQWSDAHAVALQPDNGDIVVAGSSWRGFENCCWFTLVRYKAADGALDTSFGNGDGRVFTDFGVPEEATDVVALPGGKIVAAGYVGGQAAVARYNADGSPDTTFGGDGRVTTDLAPSLQEGGDLRALAVQPDGKIVVAGEVGSTRFDFVLVRYNTDGSLDTGFGTNGIQRTDFGDYDSAEALAIQPDGRIVAAGSSGGRVALARYNTNGSLDPGFDGNGMVVTPGGAAQDMKLQSDGRIVVAGNGPGGFNVLRYNTDGGLDSDFGNGGRTATSFGGSDVAHGVAVQSDGRIVAAGQGGPADDFALARYLGGGGSTPPPPPPTADLSVTKTGPATVTIGDRATYTVRVTNAAGSTASATGVTLTDTLSGAGATLVSATPSQGSCTTTATGATCALGTLAPGASATVTVVAEPRATGTLTNTAQAAATQTDPATGNNTATATGTVNNSRGCTIIGTSGADTLNGTFRNDVICGLGGNDTLRGNDGTDTVYGDYGNDNIDGGNANDTLYGGPGNDTVNGAAGNDRVITTDGVSGNDTANGGAGTDTCTTDPGDTRISCP